MISLIAGILTFGLYAVPEVFGESPEKWNQSWNMGMTMDLPQEWKTPSGDVFQWDILVEPPSRDQYGTVHGILYDTLGYLEATFTVIYYDDGAYYSDLSDKAKLKEIMKIEEDNAKNNYGSVEFIDSTIVHEPETINKSKRSIFILEYETTYSSLTSWKTTQLFEVHLGERIWIIWLDTWGGSYFGYSGNNDQLFESFKESFRIYGDEEDDVMIKNSNVACTKCHLSIPHWIKQNAGWWADGIINDNSFVQGIQFMIKEKIILIPNLPESSLETQDGIPSWVKINAGWWADDQIDDASFVQGIEYLIKVGIIQVS